MNETALVDVVHGNPESTILIEYKGSDKVVRIDIGEHLNFDVEEGESLSGVGISEREKERRKRRKDLKLKLKNAGLDEVRDVYAISRVNEDNELQELEVKDVQEQQRDLRSPGGRKRGPKRDSKQGSGA